MSKTFKGKKYNFWLVVSTPLNNISQLVYGKIIQMFQTTKQISIILLKQFQTQYEIPPYRSNSIHTCPQKNKSNFCTWVPRGVIREYWGEGMTTLVGYGSPRSKYPTTEIYNDTYSIRLRLPRFCDILQNVPQLSNPNVLNAHVHNFNWAL